MVRSDARIKHFGRDAPICREMSGVTSAYVLVRGGARRHVSPSQSATTGGGRTRRTPEETKEMSKDHVEDGPEGAGAAPHVLVIDKDEAYGARLAAALDLQGCRTLHCATVDAYLDLNCPVRMDVVILEVDPADPSCLDHVVALRSYVGEGPGTRIVAVSSFASAAFSALLERRGADTHMMRFRGPEAMAAALDGEIRQHLGWNGLPI